MYISTGFDPIACTRINTSPASGFGFGISSTFNLPAPHAVLPESLSSKSFYPHALNCREDGRSTAKIFVCSFRPTFPQLVRFAVFDIYKQDGRATRPGCRADASCEARGRGCIRAL